jgi:NADH:ubiquinone oxidoreductase subunit F (NADH-binding)
MTTGIIKKIEDAKLLGKSGSCFSTAKKWQVFKEQKSAKKYIICNIAEGEPEIEKDRYVLKNYFDKVVEIILLAIQEIPESAPIIYIKKEYYDEFKEQIQKAIKNTLIKIEIKKQGYINGEETVICNILEGKRAEPRTKPPYPVESGINGYPTLINNIETFYRVWEIAHNQFEDKRFISISGIIPKKGICEFSVDESIKSILEKSDNLPKEKFFVIAGGLLSGEILLPNELDQPIKGAGSIVVFSTKTNGFEMLKKWSNIYNRENCDKCVSCREGIYRIVEMLESRKINEEIFLEIVRNMQISSFCQLGRRAGYLLEQIYQKVYKNV